MRGNERLLVPEYGDIPLDEGRYLITATATLHAADILESRIVTGNQPGAIDVTTILRRSQHPQLVRWHLANGLSTVPIFYYFLMPFLTSCFFSATIDQTCDPLALLHLLNVNYFFDISLKNRPDDCTLEHACVDIIYIMKDIPYGSKAKEHFEKAQKIFELNTQRGVWDEVLDLKLSRQVRGYVEDRLEQLLDQLDLLEGRHLLSGEFELCASLCQ